jgi:pimeloyl-ACP methyl ester carboxylesterase
MGGWIALRLALAHPERVSGLVLVDSAGLLFRPPPTRVLVARREVDLAENLELLFHRAPRVPRTLRRALARREPVVSLDLLASMVSRRDLVSDLLSSLDRPTLVIWGGSDRIIPPEVGEELARGIPGSSLVVLENAGHIPMFEAPRPFVDTVSGFLRGREEPGTLRSRPG